MSMKKWVIGKPDFERAKMLAEECDTDPFIALISCGRGINDESALEQFISDECCLCDPRELADITVAADIINAALENGDKIAVFGDYDCDGVVSAAVMYDYLKGRGGDVVCYIPDRIAEGYGMNIAAVDCLNAQGVKLIVTVDNGISCAEEIEHANKLGIATVVTDHHIPPAVLPHAAAVVDPHRADCPSGFKEVCGAQVAFKLCCVLDDKEPEELLPRYSDILAVAVIGDVMPLVNENRAMVKEGIRKIKSNPSVGISAILNVAGIDRKSVNSSRISFGITPRINAAGRMGKADRAFDLLLCTDMLEALKTAGEIDDDNAQRQRVEREITAAAIEKIEKNGYNDDRIIVVEGDNWHTGVIGIAAARICDRYGKPAIVISRQNGEAHGSGRSIEGFNIFEAISAAAHTLTKFGGHEQAAGVSLDPDKTADFRKAINEYAASLPLAVPKLNIDLKLNPAAMSVDMAHALKILEPYGNGNPVPIFAITGVKLEKITEISSGKHLKLLFSKNGGAFKGVLFGVSLKNFYFEIGDTLDIAVNLEANYFREEYTLSVLIRAIKMSGTDDDEFFADKAAFEDYLEGRACDTARLLPTRGEIGEIYRTVKAKNPALYRLVYLYINSIGYAKTMIAVKVLHELKLISDNDGVLSVTNISAKTDLLKSETFANLTKGEHGI